TQYLERNEEPESKQGFVDDVKPIIAYDRQIGLRMVDAVKIPEKLAGMPPPVAPVADEVRHQQHHDDLPDGRHAAQQIHLQPWRVGSGQGDHRLVHHRQQEEMIDAAVIEDEIEQIDPEAPGAVTEAPVLASGDLQQESYCENEAKLEIVLQYRRTGNKL